MSPDAMFDAHFVPATFGAIALQSNGTFAAQRNRRLQEKSRMLSALGCKINLERQFEQRTNSSVHNDLCLCIYRVAQKK